jgi:RNA polymerase sigma-70 factor (ECF subfamily)
MTTEGTPDASDAALLDAWRSGDSLAGEQLVRRHYEAVERFFMNKVTLAAVPDLVQETFLACVEARDRIRDSTRLRHYLLTIAYRVFYAHLRQRYRTPEALDQLTLASIDDSPSSLLVQRQEQRLLLEGLRAISLKYQIVLELHYWEQLTTNAIAEILGIPSSTARTRLRRARDELVAAMSARARSPELLESTLTRLDDWVERCRGELGSAHQQRVR